MKPPDESEKDEKDAEQRELQRPDYEYELENE
jgi:hypothetical protein